MPNRHSLFWKLAALLVTFFLLVISLSGAWMRHIDLESSYLSDEARHELRRYADQAEQAAHAGPLAVDAFLTQLKSQEHGWMAVLDNELQPLGTQGLDEELRQRLTALRLLDWPMSRRSRDLPLLKIPFADGQGHLLMQLPERHRPWRYRLLLNLLVQYLLPALLALVFCFGLYRVLIAPLARLREQANALRADQLHAPLDAKLARRKDELGELSHAFQHMAERLQQSVTQQRQLLRDLSHELRTPLSRLQVACETPLEALELRERVEREVNLMRTLVNSTLELAWLDAERPSLPLEPVSLSALWELLREDACFESGWSPERLPCLLPESCVVKGHLNALARALENILRNAIRHSPPNGRVCLGGQREGADWLIWIEDQGPGVPDSDLALIFQPFTRLCAERPGGDGFGLGLAIAQRMIQQQGGSLWAENRMLGLRLNIRLKTV